jgi:hypothetical protein
MKYIEKFKYINEQILAECRLESAAEVETGVFFT